MTPWSRRREYLLDKELRFHLDEKERALVARGVPRAEARRQARLALGGPEQVMELCRDARGTRWASELIADTRFALRAFRRQPGFAAVTLLILGLGIGATTAMFAVVQSVLFRPLPLPQPERLFTLHAAVKDVGEGWGVSYPDFIDLNASRSLMLAGWTWSSGTVTAPGNAAHVESRQISSQLFRVLGVSPVLGRAFSSLEDRPGAKRVAMVSDRLWQTRFAARPSVVGGTLVFDGQSFTVVGVAPQALDLLGQADVYTPIGQNTDARMQNRQGRFVQVIGRLHSGATRSAAQTEVVAISRRLAVAYPASNAGTSVIARPLLENIVGNVRGTLWLLTGALALLLALACVNIACLFLTRSLARSREWALRVALGAGRARLIRQCVTESAVFGLFGGLAGITLAAATLRPILALWPGSLPRVEEVRLDPSVLFFSLALALLCGILFGLAPALRVPSTRLEQILRGGGRGVTGPARTLHGPFVVAEIALAFILLFSAGMLGRTLLKLSALDPGFQPRNVLAARFAISPNISPDAASIRAAWRDVLLRAQQIPGVESAALADIVPMREGENVGPYRATGDPVPVDRQPLALASTVTPEYLRTLGIPLLAGRFFDEHDSIGSQPVVVIDEHLARRAFGRHNAVGQRLWMFGADTPVQVIGVVVHVSHWGLASDDQSRVRDQMYIPFAQVPGRLLHFFSSVMSIVIRTRNTPLVNLVLFERQLRGAAGDQTLYQVHTMDDLMQASLARNRFLSLLFAVFAALALLLATLGVYGALAYLTRQRTQEIGIRVALGATLADILRLVLWQGLKFAAAGVAIGVIGALAAGRVLSQAVTGLQPATTLVLALVAPSLAFAMLLAAFLPAHRAGSLDPSATLRQD